jgi:predicted flap endonuclease-1-like 5' DNA nuclease
VPYTLTKTALALLVALALGMLVGWLLWGRRKRTVTTSTDTTVDAEVQRLRARVSNLEPVVTDRDRLKAELDECRAAARSAAIQPVAAVAAPAAPAAGGEEVDRLRAERDRLLSTVAEHETTIGELRARNWNSEARVGELEAQLAGGAAASVPPTPDVAAAEDVLGRKIRLDDLKVVEGIGPKIEAMIHGTGVTTWWALANTDVAALQTMLDGGGPRYQVHDPRTWPEQARLLAEGKWAEFKALTDSLDGGKPAE